jgi:hypothetical protein
VGSHKTQKSDGFFALCAIVSIIRFMTSFFGN